MIYLHEAIRSVYPTVSTIEQDGDTVTARDDESSIIEIDMNLVSAENDRMQAEYDGLQYQRDRASEYPSWEDQLDDIYHNGIDGWKSSIKAIKDKYPKGE